MANREVIELVRELEAKGWRVTRGSHAYVAKSPNRKIPPISIPGTPSDWRALKNKRAELRRYGVKL
jgi:hypothetical protein